MVHKSGTRLISIPMSHYCEKARWGLERLGMEYYEERHLQVFHYPRTYWFSRGPNVPVLIDKGTVVQDSTIILQYLDRYADEDQRLYPRDEELLAAGHNFLLGDQFTAADLSLAYMLAPLVLPRNYGVRLPELEEMPAEARPVVEEFRASATGVYVLKLFETEKPPHPD